MRLPDSYYNPLSLIGSLIAGANLALIGVFGAAMFFFDAGGLYAGLFVYIILPIFFIFGLLLIPVGMIRRARIIKQSDGEIIRKGLRINLNDKKHRTALMIFTVGTFFIIVISAIGSYEAFHYTESNEFCGLLCHRVMEPEYTAYQESAHSRVKCVECHVGEGADWYVKSKLSGMYQVYSVLTNSYPQPISAPVHSLRPARETCERCHWPNKFYSYRIDNEKHFLSDENNTEWAIQLKMKTGSDHSSMGLKEGIHWHINPDIVVEYVAAAPDRQSIPWVRSINIATGDTVIYNDINEPLESSARDTLEMRVMDCIDCHNRPSHDYIPPQKFIDIQLANGDIPASLPEIKRLSMEVLAPMYGSYDSAMIAIETSIKEFYSSSYPDIFEKSYPQIELAIAGIEKGFSKHIFPEMKASWDVYPNHIGHMEYQGCFRCHNGNHQDDSGNVISRDCDLCHSIVLQGTSDNLQVASAIGSLEFVHPVDIGEVWKEYSCAECHRNLY